MIDERFESDELGELRATAAAAAELARDEEAFNAAHEAFLASDGAAFQAILDKLGLVDRCRLICRFFCRKHCPTVCRRFCPERPAPVDANEIREFALVLARLTADDELLKRLLEIVGSGDVEAWQEELKRRELGRFCHQLCHFLCVVHCRRRCHKLCPQAPQITNVGSIPTPTQVGPQGFGNGEGVPTPNVPFPNTAAGVGDHPFGGSPTVKGIFNMPTATEYKVEVANNPGGPYTPIEVRVNGTNNTSAPPWQQAVHRDPSVGPDPGWYKVLEIADSDGGPNTLVEHRLLDWPTGSLKDGIYYLRLCVRDGAGTERRSRPQIIQTDNTAPAKPLISLEQVTPSGDLRPLKCGKVRRDGGLIRVTIQASDPNFSRLSVAAQGNSGLSIPVVGVPEGSPPGTAAVPLSKTYNGNIADKGYPVPISFLWDPWSDPQFKSCCYVVRIDIADRALSSNTWSGGHANAGWEAIEIGF